VVSIKKTQRSAGVLAACLCAIIGTAHAEDRAVTEARTGIQSAMDTLVAALKKGTTAEEAARLWYTDDLVLSMTGAKYYHGLDSFMSTLREWVAYPVCDWKLDASSVRASGNLASAFVIETCAPNKAGEPPMVMRSLYVFRKTPEGWRATAEALTRAP